MIIPSIVELHFTFEVEGTFLFLVSFFIVVIEDTIVYHTESPLMYVLKYDFSIYKITISKLNHWFRFNMDV